MATSKAKAKSAAKKSTASATAKTVKSGPTKSVSAGKKFFSKKYEGKENIFTVFKSNKFIAALVAEIIGVFLLTIVFLAISASPLYVLFGYIGVTVVVFAISGAHLNPVITVGQAATRRISVTRMVLYIIAQTVGAMLAFIVMKAFIGGAPEVDEMAALYGQTSPTLYTMALIPEGKEWFLLFTELLGATILGLFFARALQYKRSVFTTAATIGAGVFIALIFALTTTGYVSGGFAFNPALAIAMEAFASEANIWWTLLIYVATPLAGGVIGFFLSDILTTSNGEKVEA